MSEQEDGEEKEETPDEETLFIERDISECFAVFDPKGTGTMPSKFLEKALRSLGVDPTMSELEDLFLKYDKEGFIEQADFAACALEKIKEMTPFSHLETAFAAFDFDNEGFLPGDRFLKWMTTLGNPLTGSEAKELYKLGDPSGKGVFNYSDAMARLLY